MEQVLNGWQASERETGCLNGSFPSPVLENCGLRLFLWSMSRLGSPCRFKTLQKSFWLWNSIMFMHLHCYLKWKITSAGGMGMLLDLQLRPTDCQTYCCIWALKTPLGRPSPDCTFFWKIHTAYYFQENPKAFEDLPFSVLIASAFTEVHCTQKQNRAAI